MTLLDSAPNVCLDIAPFVFCSQQRRVRNHYSVNMCTQTVSLQLIVKMILLGTLHGDTMKILLQQGRQLRSTYAISPEKLTVRKQQCFNIFPSFY